MVRFTGGLLLLVLVLSIVAAPIRAEPAPPQIKLSSCVVMATGEGFLSSIAADMRVRFENRSGDTLKTIVWRANTPVGTIDFTDRGTFSPNVSIYRVATHRGRNAIVHRFTLNRIAFDLMGPGLCSVIETINAAGETWKAPGIAPAAIDVPPVPQDWYPPVPATYDNPAHNPVGIMSCQFNLGGGRAWGYIRFRNLSPRTIDRITFRVFFGEAGLDFVNHGSFAPGATVRAGDMTRKDLPPNTYQEYTTLERPETCLAVNAQFADGTLWQNPNAGPTEPPFPVGVP